MTQGNVVGEVIELVPSPLCYRWTDCPKPQRGRAELGPPVTSGESINRRIRCLKCGVTGVQSTNTEAVAQ